MRTHGKDHAGVFAISGAEIVAIVETASNKLHGGSRKRPLRFCLPERCAPFQPPLTSNVEWPLSGLPMGRGERLLRVVMHSARL